MKHVVEPHSIPRRQGTRHLMTLPKDFTPASLKMRKGRLVVTSSDGQTMILTERACEQARKRD